MAVQSLHGGQAHSMHTGVEGAIAYIVPDREAMSNTTEGDVSRNEDNR